MQYELVVIGDPAVDPKDLEKKVTVLLTKEGYNILETNVWGKKTLSYPLNKKTEGVYIEYQLTGEGKNPQLLAKQFVLDETILRSLVLKKEEKKKKKPKSKISSPN